MATKNGSTEQHVVGDELGGSVHLHRLIHALDQLDDRADDTFTFPSSAVIQRRAGFDKAQFEASARSRGQGDAQAGIFKNHTFAPPAVAAMSEEIEGHMNAVAALAPALREEVRQKIERLGGLARDAEDDDVKRDVAEQERIERAKRVRAERVLEFLNTRTRMSRTLRIVLLVASFAALIVDTIFLGSALVKTELFSESASYVIGVVATAALALFAILSGQWGAESVYVPPGGRREEETNPVERQAERDARQRRYWAIITAVLIVVIILAIGSLRIREARADDQAAKAASSQSQTFDPSGLATTGQQSDSSDGRGQAVFVQWILLALALLSVVVLWFDGYIRAVDQERKESARKASAAQRVIAQLERIDTAGRQFEARAEELGSELNILPSHIHAVLQDLLDAREKGCIGYRDAAVFWLATCDQPELNAQIPIFESVTLPPTTFNSADVRRYLELQPVGEARATNGAAPRDTAADAGPPDATSPTPPAAGEPPLTNDFNRKS